MVRNTLAVVPTAVTKMVIPYAFRIRPAEVAK